MEQTIKKLTIVGGGSAGWLTAAVIAAEHQVGGEAGLQISLIESANIPSVGVGEGTWPTMRATLQKIGISETDFIRECDASFKQGSKFSGWVNGENNDYYYHPFSLPQGYVKNNFVPQWQPLRDKVSYADAISFQSHLCEQNLAPKQITTPEFGFMANYGYHLDAAKFAMLLQKHCVEKLGVIHIVDDVVEVNAANNGDISSVTTLNHGDISGDLFVDCSGTSSLLLGEHYKIPFICKKDILFNDSALAAQVPYNEESSIIASQTTSTAQSSGWIWDIGLSTRRGVGYTYSSKHIDDKAAEAELRAYLSTSIGEKAETIPVRKISFNPGHREVFWHKNCVAIGMAQGFIEPLEASALVMIELAAATIRDEFPANRLTMDVVAKKYNQTMTYRWQCIVDFLKLHYVLSQRDNSDYWIDNRRADTIPHSLQDRLTLWQYQPPWHHDFQQNDEIFSSASYQYVLYGMGFETKPSEVNKRINNDAYAYQQFKENSKLANQLLNTLPNNRDLINKIKEFGLQKV